MGRKYIDCRDFPDETHCTVALAADDERELIEAVVEHGVSVHGYQDSPELREQLRKAFKEGTPPI